MENSALVLIGHGSTGYEDPAFLHFQDEIRGKYPESYLVMLHGSPSVNEVLPILKEKKITHVFLYPLLLSPASHFTKDILSEGAALRSAFRDAGIMTAVIGHGLLEAAELRAGIITSCLDRISRVSKTEH